MCLTCITCIHITYPCIPVSQCLIFWAGPFDTRIAKQFWKDRPGLETVQFQSCMLRPTTCQQISQTIMVPHAGGATSWLISEMVAARCTVMVRILMILRCFCSWTYSSHLYRSQASKFMIPPGPSAHVQMSAHAPRFLDRRKYIVQLFTLFASDVYDWCTNMVPSDS